MQSILCVGLLTIASNYLSEGKRKQQITKQEESFNEDDYDQGIRCL